MANVRVYIAPIVGAGTPLDPYRCQVRGRMMIPTYPSSHASYGQPKFSWALVVAREDDWTVNDAIAENERVFGIDLPDTIGSLADLRAFLRAHTVGEIPTARRTALQTRLTNRGVDLTGITLSSTLWEVMQRIARFLDPVLEET